MSTNTLKQALEIVYGDIKNINKRVKNIESASIGVLYTETTKSAVAYQDNVSANACPYALLNKVGGMSYKSENLLNIPDVAETTINGITYKIENGVITFNGTATSVCIIYIDLVSSITIDTSNVYSSLSGHTTEIGEFGFYLTSNSSSTTYRSTNAFIKRGLAQVGIDMSNINGNNTYSQIYIYISSGITFDNVKFYPMLVSGSTAPTTYQPYFEGIRDSAVSSVISKDSNNTTLQTITIPNEIQALEGYGWGINDTCYNYIDLNTKKFIKNVIRPDLGSFAWGKDGYNNWITSVNSILAVKSILSCLCAKYPTTAYPENVDYGCKVSLSNRIVIHDKDTLTMTPEQFKEYVSGLYFYYGLATPIETDISQYLDDNSIQISANGTITYDNTYQQAIPYEYLYLEKVGANNE